ncbi:hypothetical protein CROQUDRAFT_99323 [Cronartium quercuum f. sp. fusiforme G11]|uniref:Uncharacterized protein n=1 Tax=Cronartium quercuum f. sp. fusiforme G11 TaxID=708437 RepID=A0A9P6NC34_9BASI|nr:hypothetical protein CROQUDRAFT_99323 [Cronartium quercuum f. sp. fusiforme G11]
MALKLDGCQTGIVYRHGLEVIRSSDRFISKFFRKGLFMSAYRTRWFDDDSYKERGKPGLITTGKTLTFTGFRAVTCTADVHPDVHPATENPPRLASLSRIPRPQSLILILPNPHHAITAPGHLHMLIMLWPIIH